MYFSPLSWGLGGGLLVVSAGLGFFLRRWTFSERTGRIVVVTLTFMAAVFFAWYSIWLYQHFEAHARDLGIFDQAIWNVSRGQAPASTIRGVSNLLGDHFHPLIFILAPLYWVAPTPIVLLITQALLFASLLPITYFLARAWRLSAVTGLIFATAVVVNVGVFMALSFDFHEVAFSAPLFLLVLLAAVKKRWRWYWIALAAFMLSKESMTIYAAGIGIWLLFRRQWRVGLITIATGVFLFALITKVIIPSLSVDHAYYYDKPYAQLSDSTLGVPLAVLRHPIRAITTLADRPEKVMTIKWVLSSYAFLPLGAVTFLPLTLLTLAERFWANNINLWLLQFHYQVMMNVVFAAGSLTVLAWLQRRLPPWPWIATSLAIVVLGMTVWVNVETRSLDRLQREDIRSRPITQWREALRVIPREASVSAQDGFAPHLSGRKKIYTFPTVNDAEYIILDPVAPCFPMLVPEAQARQATLRVDPNWVVVFDQGSTTVFKRK